MDSNGRADSRQLIITVHPSGNTRSPIELQHERNIVSSQAALDIKYASTARQNSEEEIVINDVDGDISYDSDPYLMYAGHDLTQYPANNHNHLSTQSEIEFNYPENRYHSKDDYYEDVNGEHMTEFEYWTLPRTRVILENKTNPGFSGNTPAAKLFKHKPHKSSHKKQKHRSDMYSLLRPGSESWMKRSATSLLLDPKEFPSNYPEERKIYFRFARKNKGHGYKVDTEHLESIILALQTQCRGWLVRRHLYPVKNENEAVRIIQRNAERYLDPWFRLLLALRPLLNSQKLEETILYLRSEIERYRNLIRMLRFENVTYQEEIKDLRHLLEEINASGPQSEELKNLMQLTSEKLTNNQEFWNELAQSNKTIRPDSTTNPNTFIDIDGTLISVPSPITQLKKDAEFYRTQVEMLEEEADVQNQRSSEHFREQIRAFGQRVEDLQNSLTMENNKVDRLTSEIEELNNMIVQGKTYERNLEYMVGQLSNQLEQKKKTADKIAEKALKNSEYTTDDQIDVYPYTKVEKQLKHYREVIDQLKSCIEENPTLLSTLKNYQLDVDGLLDVSKVGQQELDVIVIEPNSFLETSKPDVMTPRTRAQEEISELRRQLNDAEGTMEEEFKERETLEIENQQLLERISTMDRNLRRKQEEFDETVTHRDRVNTRKIEELREQLDEESLKNSKLSQQVRDMERELLDYRNQPESEEDLGYEESKVVQSKLRFEVAHYEQAFKELQEEFDQFRRENNPIYAKDQLTEKEELVRLLESEKQQWRVESDLNQVKLQTTTTLLEGAENRIKMLSKERTGFLHRINQLETERDDAIKQAATMSGRSMAEKENLTSKIRDLEEARLERDNLRKELADVRHERVESVAERSAENRQLQARLRELETHHEARVSDLKEELERAREDIQRLQLELQCIQASELEQKSANQQLRRKIDEMDDQLSNSTRRISMLERLNSDMNSELIRANADLGAIREAATLKRASRTRMAEEFYQASEEDTEDDTTTSIFRDGISSPFSRRSASSMMSRKLYRPVSTTSIPGFGIRPNNRISQSNLSKKDETFASSQNLRRSIPRTASEVNEQT